MHDIQFVQVRKAQNLTFQCPSQDAGGLLLDIQAERWAPQCKPPNSFCFVVGIPSVILWPRVVTEPQPPSPHIGRRVVLRPLAGI